MQQNSKQIVFDLFYAVVLSTSHRPFFVLTFFEGSTPLQPLSMFLVCDNVLPCYVPVIKLQGWSHDATSIYLEHAIPLTIMISLGISI